MSKPTILIQGESLWPEFRQAECWLRERFDVQTEVTQVVPQAVVCVQRFLEDVSSARMESLRQQIPAAQWIAFVGPWYIGELRAAESNSGFMSVPWHAWEAAFPVILQPRSVLPRTSVELERVLARRRGLAGVSRERVIGVCAETRETQNTLLDLVKQAGATAVAVQIPSVAECGQLNGLVIDLVDSSDSYCKSPMWREIFQRVPTIVTSGFARPSEVSQLHAAGVAAVVSKPYRWATIERALANALQPIGKQADAA